MKTLWVCVGVFFSNKTVRYGKSNKTLREKVFWSYGTTFKQTQNWTS